MNISGNPLGIYVAANPDTPRFTGSMLDERVVDRFGSVLPCIIDYREFQFDVSRMIGHSQRKITNGFIGASITKIPDFMVTESCWQIKNQMEK